MVGHQMPSENLALLLLRQRVKDLVPDHVCPKMAFRRLLGTITTGNTTNPTGSGHRRSGLDVALGMRIGSDQALTFILSLLVIKPLEEGAYFRNGQACSSFTGRTSGSPLSVR
jgi:hypothetical protein